jgi:hypothetical protein
MIFEHWDAGSGRRPSHRLRVFTLFRGDLRHAEDRLRLQEFGKGMQLVAGFSDWSNLSLYL